MAKKEIYPLPVELEEDINQTIALILERKEQERILANERREMENWLVQAIGADPNVAGQRTYGNDLLQIKFKPSIDTKVDVEKLRSIAEEYGREDLLDSLFRWKAEIIKTEWDDACEDDRNIFIPALETKANRPQMEFTYNKEK